MGTGAAMRLKRVIHLVIMFLEATTFFFLRQPSCKIMRSLKKSFFGIGFCLCFFQVFGQNLVANPGFEEYNQCPSLDYFSDIKDWYILSHSPDYFYMTCGGPYNGTGFQLPHNGEGYIGFHQLEKYGVKLTESLVSGKTYSVSMFISMRDMTLTPGDFINVHFSADSICSDIDLEGLPTVQLINPMGLIDDTMNWVPVSGTYTASGYERYIAISMQNEAYYYVDDVDISCTDPNGCETPSQSIREVQIPNIFTPNNDGVNDEFNLVWNVNPALIPNLELNAAILNRWGNVVTEFSDPFFEWDGSSNGKPLPEGVYFCRLELIRGVCNESYILNGFIHLTR